MIKKINDTKINQENINLVKISEKIEIKQNLRQKLLLEMYI